MLRAPTSIALGAAILAALSAPALGATPEPGSAAVPQASVKLVTCSVATHEAAFKARMIRIEGTQRMGMRFTLLERTSATGFAPVQAPGLGRWRRSRPGVGTFGYRQAVKGLPQNAVHRMRVDFRWYGADGEVLSRTRRTSRACRQFDALPNLGVAIVGSAPTRVRGVRRYRVRVCQRRARRGQRCDVALLGGRRRARHRGRKPAGGRPAARDRVPRAGVLGLCQGRGRPRRRDRRELRARQRPGARVRRNSRTLNPDGPLGTKPPLR